MAAKKKETEVLQSVETNVKAPVTAKYEFTKEELAEISERLAGGIEEKRR